MIKHVGKNLYRTDRPGSYKELKDAGITVAVRLNSGVHEQFNEDKLEYEDPRDFGVHLITIPMSDVTPPTKKQLQAFLHICRKYFVKGEKVAVYCLHGADRTGSQVLNYEVNELEVPYEEAKARMYENGFHKLPYILWVPFLKKRILEIKKEEMSLSL